MPVNNTGKYRKKNRPIARKHGCSVTDDPDESNRFPSSSMTTRKQGQALLQSFYSLLAM
jgi:hypothetical protein